MRKVVVVRAGGLRGLSAEAGDYDHLIEVLKKQVEGPTGWDQNPPKVEVVANVEEVLDFPSGVEAVVFVSGSMLLEARQLKKRQPHINIVVFTAAMPKEVVVFNKDWIEDTRQLKKVVLWY